MRTYAAYYDDPIRMDSSSGGLFSCIAMNFEIVYGVAMTEDRRNCEFVRCEGDISSLRGSKYIQARMGDIYQLVEKDLNNGNKVLFSGTACQVNGLYSFLGSDYSNLFTIDIICHGVVTPKVWSKYTNGMDLHSISFRAKDIGWYEYGMKINDVFIPNHSNKYMKLMLEGQCLRPSCYECIYKRHKKSDVTLGDFWGIDNIAPKMNDNKGTSLVIVRTDKGQLLFECIKSGLKCVEVDYRSAITYNAS